MRFSKNLLRQGAYCIIIKFQSMTKSLLVSHSQFLSLVYHDLFDYPLTRSELEYWQIGSDSSPKHKVGVLGEFCFLYNRDVNVLSRTSKAKVNDRKYLKAVMAAKVLSAIPSCQMVAISGALAMGNAKAEDDIDLFIVTSGDCLWITRLVSYVLLKFAGIPVRRVGDSNVCDKICLNLWVDTNHLSVPTRDIYSAHEILQAKVLFDRGDVYQRFLESNKWVETFFPNGFNKAQFQSECQMPPFGSFDFTQDKFAQGKNSKFQIINALSVGFMRIFEAPARLIQRYYMRNKKTREKVGRGFAFFHPKSWREMIIRSFLQRLEGMLVGKSTFVTSATPS